MIQHKFMSGSASFVPTGSPQLDAQNYLAAQTERPRPATQMVLSRSLQDSIDYNLNTSDFQKKLHGDYSMNSPQPPLQETVVAAVSKVGDALKGSLPSGMQLPGTSPFVYGAGALAVLALGGLVFWKLHK